MSGPGRLSKRTDGGPTQKVRDLTGGKYGEGAQFRGLESSAAMAGRESSPQSPSAGPPQQPVDVVPFGAPSQNPDEPVTAGSPMGAGVGPAAMGLQDPQQQMDTQDAQRLVSYLPALEHMANLPGASQAVRAYVRYIRALGT